MSIENKVNGKLISPCKCTGSIKYIHNECLKTWIISQEIPILTSKCEICHTFYKMEITYGLKFLLFGSKKENFINIISIMFLLIFVVSLITFIIYCCTKW